MSAFQTVTPVPDHHFDIGDQVTIKRGHPPGHRRTPDYIRGKTGEIERICGVFPNPEELAYGFDGLPGRVLYRVKFKHVAQDNSPDDSRGGVPKEEGWADW